MPTDISIRASAGRKLLGVAGSFGSAFFNDLLITLSSQLNYIDTLVTATHSLYTVSYKAYMLHREGSDSMSWPSLITHLPRAQFTLRDACSGETDFADRVF